MSTPLVSIVIPTLNAGKTLQLCLESLDNLNFDKNNMEVIIADGGSTDDTLNIAQKFPFCKIISSESTGPLAGRIDGLQHAQGKIIAYIDADTIVDTNWLQNGIEELLHAGEEVGAIGGPSKIPRKSLWTQANDIFLVIAFLAGFSIQTNHVESKKIVSMIPTCNLLCFKKTLERIQPFKWCGFGEDIELSARIRSLDLKLILCPNVVVWHMRRESPSAFFWEMLNYARGRFHFSRMHRSPRIMQFLPQIVLLTLLFIIILLGIHGSWSSAIAFICSTYLITLAMPLYVGRKEGHNIKAIILTPLVGLVAIVGWTIGSIWETCAPSK